MSETELPAYLMNLEPEQLEQVRKMLVQRIEDQQQQKLKQRSLPPAFHDLDAVALFPAQAIIAASQERGLTPRRRRKLP
jgi:hypothetical protein